MSSRLILLSMLLAAGLLHCGDTTVPAATCTADSECVAGQRCDTTSGICVVVVPDAGTTSGGVDAGTHANHQPVDAGSEGSDPDAGTDGADAGTDGADAGTGTPDAGDDPSGPACNGPTDCLPNQACDAVTKTCVTTCGPTQPCNGGCCDSNGKCQATSDDFCGSGLCSSCSDQSTDRVCVEKASGSACGCHSAADCAPGQACDPGTKKCTSSCGGSSGCNGACCNNGTCGNSNTACGPTCTNCQPTANANNKVCIGGTCGCNSNADCGPGNICDRETHQCSGCNSNADCPVGQACDPFSRTCGTDCTNAGSCNGACCPNATGPRTCQNVNAACGGTCTNCAANATTPVCLPGGVCGCTSSSQCPYGTACNNGVCSSACNPSAGIRCNGGCCRNGTCQPGNEKFACGSGGGDCSSCTAVCCTSGGTSGGFCTTSKLCEDL